MDFDAFIDAAWNDHAEQTEAVAQRLAQSVALITLPDQVPPYARLVTHVFGEHLGHWAQGVALLRALPAFDASAPGDGAVTRGIAVLEHCAGAASALDGLDRDDRIAVLATAASTFCGRKAHRRAIATYAEALALAAGGLRDGSPALRALAAAGNNIAVELEEKPDRDAAENDAMVAAAQGGLTYWQRAGTWLETERAHYRLSCSLRASGDHRRAIDHARACLAVCAANDAPAFERFFGHAALACAQREAGLAGEFAASRHEALRCYGEVPTDERRWCAADLARLGG